MEVQMAALSPVLDHVVIDVRDRIDEAMRCFQSLGFQLTPRGRHTLGSVNHLAMFATDYLELLGFAGDGAIRPEIMHFPVGLNRLVFTTADADSVHAQAAASGLPILPVQSFSRPVTLDGVARDARFRTTRLDPEKVAMGRVYFCEHQTPDLVWRPEWQTHPNGACAIARVVVATADPQRTARLFRGLFGDEIVADRNGAQNNRRRSRPGGALHAGCGSSRIRRDGSRGGRPNRTYGGSRDQSPVAARGGTMPALRPGLTRRAAPPGRAGRRRLQYGDRL